MPPESGIVVPVPRADAVVGELRSLYDPQARNGVPAHVTVLYPFAVPADVSHEIAALRQVFREVRPFEFRLTEVRRFPETAYLHPDPPLPFIRLTELLVHRWPQFPPYGGQFPVVTPHLTVAHRVGVEVLDAIAQELSGRLPIQCQATEAWLMCSDDMGMWSRHEVFEFDGRRP